MNRPELNHRYKRQKIQTAGEGIFGDIVKTFASAITSNIGKKIVSKTVDSAVDFGAKKAGEFIGQTLTKKPGDFIVQHLSTVRKPQ